MTTESEAVERALDGEWRSTREIVERAGLPVTAYNVTHFSRKLCALARQGYAERRKGNLPAPRGRGYLWRLKP